MLKKLLLSIIALAATCTYADAAPTLEDSPFYGVFSLGRSTNSGDSAAVDNYNANHGFATSSTSSGNRVTGGKIQLGYNLGKTFALEGGWNYLGKAGFDSTTNLGGIHGSREASLYNLDVVGKLPLTDRFSVLARFGGYYWKTESELPNATTLGTTRVNDNGYDLKIGAGMQYEFTQKFGLRGEYERFNGIGKSTSSGDSKVNQFTVGAVLKF